MAEITVQAGTIEWSPRGYTNLEMRVYPSYRWTPADGNPIPAGRVKSDNYYKAVACVADGDEIDYASFTLDSHPDAIDDPNRSTYTLAMFGIEPDNTRTYLGIVYRELRVDEEPLSQTLADIIAFSSVPASVVLPDDYYTAAEVDTGLTNARARANHTGTQLANTISDLSTAVQGITDGLYQEALVAGETIKTINGYNPLGAGDISILEAESVTIAGYMVENAGARFDLDKDSPTLLNDLVDFVTALANNLHTVPFVPGTTTLNSLNVDSFAQLTPTWTAPATGAAVVGYVVQIATDPDFTADLVQENVGLVLTTPLGGLEPGETYYVRVKALAANGNSGPWSATLNATTLADTGLLDDLVAYWKLDEANGDAIDAHGANDLTDGNTVGATDGVVAGARDFEQGNSEYFTRPDNADLSVGDIAFTIAGWVRVESEPGFQVCVLGKWDVAGASREYLWIYDSGISDAMQFWVSPDGAAIVTVSAPDPAPVGEWAFLVMWHDPAANQIRIQMNDGAVQSTPHAAGVFAGTSPFEMGRIPAGLNFDGALDEVGFWKGLLTAEQRTYLYNSGDGRTYEDL